MKDLTINVPTMTVKEVADALGVSEITIRHKAKELFPESIRNGIPSRFTEYQVQEIKENIVPRNLALKGKVNSAVTELEMERMTIQVIQYHMNRNAELEAKVAELAPKAEVYSLCCESERLHTIQDLGKITGIGAQNIFDRLVKDCVIYRVVSDGDKHYRSHYQYDRYFKPIIEPYSQNGIPKTHSRLMLTTEGFMHFCKKYGTKGATEWQ